MFVGHGPNLGNHDWVALYAVWQEAELTGIARVEGGLIDIVVCSHCAGTFRVV